MIQNLRGKFCQVTRRMPLNALTIELYVWHDFLKKQVSLFLTGHVALARKQSYLLCRKAGGYLQVNLTFLYHLLHSKSPNELIFWGPLKKQVRFCWHSGLPWLFPDCAFVGFASQWTKNKRGSFNSLIPSCCSELQANETQSVTPWKGLPAHTGVTFTYVSRCPPHIHWKRIKCCLRQIAYLQRV